MKLYCKIPAMIGMTSLVGVNQKEYPYSFGNYFSFHNPSFDIDDYDGIRCLNMWKENFKEAKKRFLTDEYVEGFLYTEKGRRWFVVFDDRIPMDWYYNEFCWTGCSSPLDMDMISDMYSIWGDPSNDK
jgi:hypothetical protein